MMTDLTLTRKHNSNTHYTVHSDSPAILQELTDFFTFETPGVQFKRNKHWDGKTRLFTPKTHQIFIGLADHLYKFATDRGYSIQFPPDDGDEIKVSLETINKVAMLPPHIEERDYQAETVTYALKNKRCVIVSPTGSGKSLSIYKMMLGLLISGKQRGLIIVPTINLVEQLYADFVDYAKSNPKIDIESLCHRVHSGESRITNKKIVISTWQSLFEMDREYFSRYQFIIGDEAHTFQAKSLKDIMNNLVNCDVRIGTTGTTQDAKVHKLVLQGLFGRIHQVATTKELMDRGILAELTINCVIMKHPKQDCEGLKKKISSLKKVAKAEEKAVGSAAYAEEINYICSSEKRNEAIQKLSESLKGNTLILYQFVEKHGDLLYKLISSKSRKAVHYVNGSVEVEVREKIREIAESSTDNIIIASYGTFSTGTNIKNLDSVIFASPSKSKIRVLQSIGRSLRTTETKKTATLYDIVDDMRVGTWINISVAQFQERINLYSREKFKYSIKKLDIS